MWVPNRLSIVTSLHFLWAMMLATQKCWKKALFSPQQWWHPSEVMKTGVQTLWHMNKSENLVTPTATNTNVFSGIRDSSCFSTWIWSWLVICSVCLMLTSQPAITTIQQRSRKSGCNGGAPSMLLWLWKQRRSYVAMAMENVSRCVSTNDIFCEGFLKWDNTYQ